MNILLKDRPLNRIKLKQFCLSFTVPTAERSLLWNLILGIMPVYTNSTKYVKDQREEAYEDVLRAVKIMRYVDEKTPRSRVFYVMWLLENKKLHSDVNIYQDSNFVNIVEVLLQTFESDYEVYWVAKEFYAFTVEIQNDFPKLKELTFNLLEKEDAELYSHLEKHDILQHIPLESWYANCFASTISEPALIRIWDKICGGSRKIVVFVFLVLLKTLKMNFMRCNDLKQFCDHMEKKTEDQDDLIVKQAIEVWQNNKNHNEFMVHHKNN